MCILNKKDAGSVCLYGKMTYKDRLKGGQISLSRTQAGPGRKVKQEQEEISRKHVPRLFLGSVQLSAVPRLQEEEVEGSKRRKGI